VLEQDVDFRVDMDEVPVKVIVKGNLAILSGCNGRSLTMTMLSPWTLLIASSVPEGEIWVQLA